MIYILGTFVSLIYLLVLMHIYNTKKKENTIENKKFKKILYIVLFGHIVTIIKTWLAYAGYSHDWIPLMIMDRTMLVYSCMWITTFTTYVYITAYKEPGESEQKFIKKHKKVGIAHNVILVIMIILMLVLPIKTPPVGSTEIIRGLATYIGYTISIFYILYWAYITLKNIKKIYDKKFMPLVFLTSTSIFAILFQVVHLEVSILIIFEALSVYLIYFSIENPDIDIIKKLEKAEEQLEDEKKQKKVVLNKLGKDIIKPLERVNEIVTTNVIDSNRFEKEEIENIVAEITEKVNSVITIEGEDLSLNKIQYNTYDLFMSIFNEAKLLSKEKDIEVISNWDEGIPSVLIGDKEKIKKAKLNIINFIINNMRKGKIILDIFATTNKDICEVVTTISSNDKGMTLEEIKKIEETNKDIIYMKKIVEFMNGKFNIQSEVGIGTKFTLTIRQNIKNVDGNIFEERDKKFDFRSYKALIVDDNNLNLQMQEKLLSNYGFKVNRINNAYDTLKEVKENDYDLVIIDDNMSGIKIEELIEQIKSKTKFNGCIVATGKIDFMGKKEKFKNLGFTDYIEKPLTKLALNEFLKNYMVK